MKLLVANLPFDISESRLRELFAPHGEVGAVSVVADPEIGLGCAWAVVEMVNDAEARAAETVLNGLVVDGRPVTIKESADHGGAPGPRQARGWT